MKQKFFITALCTLMLGAAHAQDLTSPQPLIDCGQVMFRRPVDVNFTLVNKSGHPLIIKKAYSSCGCSVISYPQKAIPAGDTIKVTATYDAKQMGHFEKRFALYPDNGTAPIELTLRGVVVPEVKNYTGNYPKKIGSLLADNDVIEFDDVNKGERPVQRIHVMNNTTKAVQPVVMHLPGYLEARVSPTEIAPGHTGEITITLKSSFLRDFGLTQTSIYLGMFPGDKVAPEKEIPVSAVLLPDFNKLSDVQLDNAPQLQLSTTKLNLGAFGRKSKLKGEVLLQNIGKSTLNIRSLQMFTTGLQLSLNKTTLAPGEGCKLKITAYAKQLKAAKTQPRLLMITNDPNKPKVIITIQTQ